MFQKFTVSDFRSALVNWKRFFVAAFVVIAALSKAGVPLVTTIPGLALAGLIIWQVRPRQPLAPLASPVSTGHVSRTGGL